MVLFEVMQFDACLQFFSLFVTSFAIQGPLLPYQFQDRLFSNSSNNVIFNGNFIDCTSFFEWYGYFNDANSFDLLPLCE